jgi:hypothetical protein
MSFAASVASGEAMDGAYELVLIGWLPWLLMDGFLPLGLSVLSAIGDETLFFF